MARVVVGKKIYVCGATRELLDYCNEHYVLDNPDYYKKVQMGKWTGNTPKSFCLYEKEGGDLILPFGAWNVEFFSKLKKICGDVVLESDISPIRPISYKSNINLYDYQEKAVTEALRTKNGVIVMPCGAGKTQTALELIARVGGRCLWLTHTQDLLNQSMNRAKSVLGVGLDTYGTITGGKVNIGSGITFATVQTMVNIDLKEYEHSFDMVVVDECHKAIGSPTKMMQFYKVVSALSCRYKIGLTATPKRADGLEASMFALLGKVIHEVPKEAVKNTTCKVNVVRVETSYVPDPDIVLAGDGTINYGRLVDDLISNKERFALVSSYICGLKGCIVLANRVDYIDRLCKAYDGKVICLSTLGNSKAAKVARKDALTKLNNGEVDCVFATYQLAKEGLDVPNLRYVVFATPEKDSTTIEQSTGRVGRKAEGKSHGTVIDFVDEFGMYKGWWKKRLSIYKKIGCDIIE